MFIGEIKKDAKEGDARANAVVSALERNDEANLEAIDRYLGERKKMEVLEAFLNEDDSEFINQSVPSYIIVELQSVTDDRVRILPSP